MPSPIQTFDKDWKILEDEMIKEINKGIAKGLTANEAAKKAMEEVDFANRLESMVLGAATARVAATRKIIDIKKLERFFLNKHWPDTQYTLAQSIAPNNYRKVIVSTIQDQLKANKAYATIAKKITDTSPISGDLPKFMDDLVRQARRGEVLLGPLKKAQSQVNRLARSGAPTQRLKKAYANLLNVVQDGNKAALNKAVTRAMKAKARYNAQRIAITETARAHASLLQTQMDEDDDIVGFRRNLSSRHPKADVCDLYERADLYGMGPGVAPKGAPMNYPAHPHDLCFFTMVYRSEVKNPTFQINNGAKWLKDNPKEAKDMMTRKGYKNFVDNPNSWQSNVTGYNAKRVQSPPLPKGATKAK